MPPPERERRDRRGYDGLFDAQELRDYAEQLNAERNTASLPRGFRISPRTPEPPRTPRTRRTRRIRVHDDPFGGPLILDPDDEDDYPEPPPPAPW